MKVRNKAGFDFSIQLPGALRPLAIIPATGVHSVPDEYQHCKQCDGLLEKGWLEIVTEEVSAVPAPKPEPKPTPPKPKRRRRQPVESEPEKSSSEESKPKKSSSEESKPEASSEPKAND